MSKVSGRLCIKFEVDTTHERSLDNILSHPLKAEDIEDLCEALGFPDYAFELKDDRKRQEEDDA
jgi:hypothetical protein